MVSKKKVLLTFYNKIASIKCPYPLIQKLRLLFKRRDVGGGRAQDDPKFIGLGAGKDKYYFLEKDKTYLSRAMSELSGGTVL